MTEITIVLEELAQLSHEGTRKRYEKIGEPLPYFAVKMGDLNKIAKQYKNQNELCMPLWRSRYLDAQHLAILIADPESFSQEEIKECLEDSVSINVLDKFAEKVIAPRKDASEWSSYLASSSSPVLQRLSWRIESRFVAKRMKDDEKVKDLLLQISQQLPYIEEPIKWTMNQTLAEIGIAYPEYRDEVIEIAEEIGAYRDMKVAKGCTSAFVPDWIAAVVRRKEK